MPLLIALLGIFAAFAEEPPADTFCVLQTPLSGELLGFYFVGQVLGGEGELRCESPKGETIQPVTVRLMGGDAAFDFSSVRKVSARSERVGPVHGVGELLGSYYTVASGAGSLLAGRAPPLPGLTLALSGAKSQGLAAQLAGATLILEAR